MSWIQIALFGSREKARPLQQRLVAAGIPAKVCGESPLARMWFVPSRDAGGRLMVPAHQLQCAKERLHEWDSEGALRDMIRCPECNSFHVQYPQYAEHSLLTNLILGLGAASGRVERDYYCADCHFTWPKHGTRPRRNRRHLAPHYFLMDMEEATPTTNSAAPRPSGSQEERPEQKKAA